MKSLFPLGMIYGGLYCLALKALPNTKDAILPAIFMVLSVFIVTFLVCAIVKKD